LAQEVPPDPQRRMLPKYQTNPPGTAAAPLFLILLLLGAHRHGAQH